MLLSPVSAYTAKRDAKTNVISVYYNDPKIHDEETVYEFNPDGSANSRSCAWGGRTKCPVGAFSDIIKPYEGVQELNSTIACQLAREYSKYCQNNKDKVQTIRGNGVTV